ncbi:glycerate kinase family protein [Oenococcus oeni]|uniref:glycerate kinase family protein n=1 Tax=Oenococcus oeni TaxID=1247 RepID=UPI0008F96852|nr:glycerate kinase [Oenococcus oeni]OIM25332.1 glycerate 2-kinase [Oenococcus oeni]SYW14236.1 Glycerate kinase [Oenococcus oeni]SYW16934.1 Glycerate kinase [Oenococcus oeni]
MKFVIAPDSFKGSLTAKEAADAIHEGLLRIFPHAEYEIIPMADGGEGTVQSLVDATDGDFETIDVLDPLEKKAKARYGLLGNQKTAVIEMAAASGIQFVNEETKNPLITTTFGTGQMILDAIHKGAREIIIGIGGSATTDGGQGMAEALGVQFLDADGHPIKRGGAGLAELDHIDLSKVDPLVAQTKIRIASDVVNPLVGSKGSARVFGPQKGATRSMIEILDKNLKHYADIIQHDLGKKLADFPGAGAAGGLGAGLLAFTNSQMEKGVEIVVEMTRLKERSKGADYVITGEGAIDSQTQYGKTPMGTAQAVKAAVPNVKVVALAGNVGDGIDQLYQLGIDSIFCILTGVVSLDQAIKNAKKNLTQTAENVGRLISQQ